MAGEGEVIKLTTIRNFTRQISRYTNVEAAQKLAIMDAKLTKWIIEINVPDNMKTVTVSDFNRRMRGFSARNLSFFEALSENQLFRRAIRNTGLLYRLSTITNLLKSFVP